MSNSAAVKIAQAITEMIPAQPKGLGFGEERRQAWQAHTAASVAAVAVWQYAATLALNAAASAAPAGWVVDQDNLGFIKGCQSIADLVAMCDPAYPWSGRWSDQA